MPFFNGKELVAAMIDSIIANTFQEWELLAIDDGSDEETIQFLKKYETDERIHFIKRRETPKGAQTCRNIGLTLAKGEYIVFFDSDDFVAPYCFEQRISMMEKRKELDFMVFPSGTLLNNKFVTEPNENVYGYKIFNDDTDAFIKKMLPFIVWNNIYRTQVLKENTLYWDTKILSLQDSDYNLQNLLAGLKYDYAKAKPDYGYRIEERGDSISKKINNQEHQKSHLYHIEKDIICVQKKYGHKYDKSLHEEILFLFNKTMSNGIDNKFAKEMLNLEYKHKVKGRHIFKLQIIFGKVANKFLPDKMARQLTMVFYLLHLRTFLKGKPILIKKV